MHEESSEITGQRLLFRQTIRCHIARVIIWYCNLITSIHHGMALFKHACEKLLRHYQAYWSKRKSKSRRLEGDYHGQRMTRCFLWKEGVKPSDTERCLCAVCGNKASAGSTVSIWIRSLAVASKLHGRLFMSGIATSLKKDSVNPFGSCDGDRSLVQVMRGIYWVTSCLVFSLMIVKLLPMTLAQIIYISLSY